MSSDVLPSAPATETGSDKPNLSAGETRVETTLEAKEGHLVFSENCKGLSYEQLFAPYLEGPTRRRAFTRLE